MGQAERFTLHAYVCGRSCVRVTDHIGVMTVTSIFVERPANCRYAVVSRLTGEVVVLDLYNMQIQSKPPPVVGTYEDVDQAIMATMMMYSDD